MTKFNARSVDIDGHRFDSAAEGRRYATLAALERAGKIAELELHPRFDCVVAGVKIAATSPTSATAATARRSSRTSRACARRSTA